MQLDDKLKEKIFSEQWLSPILKETPDLIEDFVEALISILKIEIDHMDDVMENENNPYAKIEAAGMRTAYKNVISLIAVKFNRIT